MKMTNNILLFLSLLLIACNSNNFKKKLTHVKLEKNEPLIYKKEIAVNLGHFGYIDNIEYSPSGKYLASSADGILIIWDIEKEEVLKTIDAHENIISQIIFSPDEKYILTSSHDKTTKIWNIYSGALVRTFSGNKKSIACSAVSSDFRYLVTGGWDKTIFLWDIKTGKKIKEFKGHTDRVLGLTFSPDNKQFASCGWDKLLKIWDIKTGNEQKSIEVYRSNLFQVKYVNKKKIITSSSKNIKLWDITTGKYEVTYNATSGLDNNIDLSKDKKYLAFGNFNKIKIWDIKTAELFKEFDLTKFEKLSLSSGNSNIVFSPDVKSVAIARNSIISIFNLKSGLREKVLKGEFMHCLKSFVEPKSKQIIQTYTDSTVRIWDIKKSFQKMIFMGDNYLYSSTDFHIDNNEVYIANVTFRGDFKISLINSGKKSIKFKKNYSEFIESCKYSNSGKYLAILKRNEIQILDGKTGEPLKEIPIGIYSTKPIVFHPNETILAFAQSGNIILYDIRRGKEILNLQGHSSIEIKVIEFSPDGEQLVSASNDNIIILWGLIKGIKIQKFKGHNDFITSIKFLKNKKSFISSSRDGTIIKWDIESGKEIYRIKTLNRGSSISIFNNDKFIIYSGGGENKIFEVSSGKLLLTFVSIPNSADWIVYSPDNKYDGKNHNKYLHYYQGLDINIITKNDTNYVSGLLRKVLLPE